MNYAGIRRDVLEHGGLWIDGNTVYRINPETRDLEETRTVYYQAVKESCYVPGEYKIYGYDKDRNRIDKTVDHLDYDNIWTSMEYKYHDRINTAEWDARVLAYIAEQNNNPDG